MLFVFLFLTLLTTVFAGGQPDQYSFSPAVGSGHGHAYSITGEGRITAVRVWEAYNNYIYGMQFRYGFTWSHVVGYQYGRMNELELYEGEAIVQVSGKYAHFIQSVVFTTNRGRSLYAGQGHGHSFNMYPTNSNAELRIISGRVHGPITSIGTHWAVLDPVEH